MAPVASATGEILEQYRGAGSPQNETVDRSGPRLWRLLHSPTNTGGLRGDGDDQERAGSEHWWQRHQGPGKVHRRAVPGYCLSCHLILSQNDLPTADAKLCNRTPEASATRPARSLAPPNTAHPA